MAGLYVHIPFCHSKCSYCDFYSTPSLSAMEQVVERIVEEWGMRRDEVGAISTVYVGGGTPSILPDTLLGRLLAALPLDAAKEVTIEVNPEDVDLARVGRWLSMGVNRVSMGVQSLDDGELKAIGRRHSAVQAIQAIEDLQRGGISNFSCDLIYGLPGQDEASWHRSLTRMLDFGMPHFSAYCLSYEPGTRLYAMQQAGRIVVASDELCAAMYDILTDEARRRGYEHYEISNFALPGSRSMHNSAYWRDEPYVGLGPAAHSFDGRVRRVNPSSIKKYLACLPTFEIEDETDDERFNDLIVTRLRTSEGLPLAAVPESLLEPLLRAARPYVTTGVVEIDDTNLRITEHGWLVADAVMRDLMVV